MVSTLLLGIHLAPSVPPVQDQVAVVTPPGISSSGIVGDPASGSAGLWTGEPSLSHQWQKLVDGAWSDIAGETTLTLSAIPSDAAGIRLLEIPNGDRSKAVPSNSISVGAPAFTVAPSVSTTGKVGSGVTGSAGTATGASTFAYRHEYLDAFGDWQPMEGETGLDIAEISDEYDLTQGRLAVYATGPGGTTVAYSDPYSITEVAPVITDAGSISGTAKVGSTRTHAGLTYTGRAAVQRQWRSAGSDLAGEIGLSHVTTEAQDRQTDSVYVVVSNSGGSVNATVTGSTITYNAPAAASLGSLTLTEALEADTLDLKAMFSVSGDSDLSGCTFAIVSGGISGMTRTGNLYAGTPDRPRAAATLTVSATNSGGTVNSTRTVIVNERSLGTAVFDYDFASSYSPWAAANSLTPTIVSGEVQLVSGVSNGQLRLNAVTLTSGQSYRLKLGKLNLTAGAGTPELRAGTGTGSAAYGQIRTSTAKQDVAGNYYLDFVALSASGFFTLVLPASGMTVIADNVVLLPHGAAATVPAAMGSGDWSTGSSDVVLGDTIYIAVTTAPNDGGSSITGYEYTLNGGTSWQAFSPALTGTGSRTVPNLPLGTAQSNIAIRARNANGPALVSDIKSASPGFPSSCKFSSPSGNDTTGNGSWASPWRTAQKLAATLTAGQTGYLLTGSYAPFAFANSGTAGNPITIRTHPTQHLGATVTGTGTGTGTLIAAGCNAVGKSYLHVEGIRFSSISGAGAAFFGVDGSVCGHIVFTRNQIDESSNAGIFAGGSTFAPNGTTDPDEWRLVDVEISYNDITATNAPSGTNECISVGNGLDGFWIHHNLVHDSLQYGIDAKLGAKNGWIYSNVVWNMSKHGIYLDSACRTNANIYLYDNIIYDCDGNGITVDREAARGNANPSYGAYQNVDGVYIFRNRVSRCRRGILIYKHSADLEVTVVQYDGATSTGFDLNETLTGANGATGRIIGHIPLTGTTGTLYVAKGNATAYTNDNAITAPGASAIVNGTPALQFPGLFNNVWVFHNTFSDATNVEPGGEDFEFSGLHPIATNFRWINNLATGGPDTGINSFASSTGYVATGNITASQVFADRNASPPDLSIATGSTAATTGSNTYNLATLLAGKVDHDGNTFANVDAAGAAYANPPSSGALQAV